MVRSLLFALTLLLSSAAFGEFTVSPIAGPAGGGTLVTIKGSFGSWPYEILFDGVPAKSAVRVDAETFVAVTPPHVPGTVPVTIFEYDVLLETGKTFNYVGDASGLQERILVPLLTPPVHGAFGSEFHTQFDAYNASGNAVVILGLDPPCFLSVCPPPLPHILNPGKHLSSVEFLGTPGRFLYVPAALADDVVFHLRVHDVTRAALNFGTEIPVVRESEMPSDRVTLIGVPTDPRFRNTLRIYSTGEAYVDVTFTDGIQTIVRQVTLPAGNDIFEPAYATISDFPTFASGAKEIDVEVAATSVLLDPPQIVPLWAFISVTNNETQVITTITPQ